MFPDRCLAIFALSALRAEREGTHRVSDGEGEVVPAEIREPGGSPHLTPTLSAPEGGEGEGLAQRCSR